MEGQILRKKTGRRRGWVEEVNKVSTKYRRKKVMKKIRQET